MRTAAPGTLLLASLGAKRGHADPSLGFFLMLLMAGAMALLAGDIASASGGWDGLSTLHETMQTILLMAAVGTGCTGAALWVGPGPAAA